MAQKYRNHVTIRTVAADAGVSVAAVSKVLRAAYGVSPELRSRVEASVAKLGYRPRAAARAMRGQSYTIGVVLPDIRNPFFSDILDGVNAALERTQYRALLGISQSATSIETAVVDLMVDWQMDGVILIGPRMVPSEMAAVAERIPTVAIAYHEREAAAFDTINNDDRVGARLVVTHLAEAGCKKIAFLSLNLPGLGEETVVAQREAGYRAAMRDVGLASSERVVLAEQTDREVQIVAKQLLQSADPPDAIFCWTDFVAFEVLSVAREIGLSVPGDLSVVGYDNSRDCDLVQHSLSSIDQSGQVLGLQAARLLVERINGREKTEHFIVNPRLVIRGSSQPARVRK